MDCPKMPEIFTPAENFLWSVLGDGTVSIEEYTGNDENVVIPEKIDGKRVTVIGRNSFQFSNIISLTLPNGVTKIECCAFASCDSLKSINLPDSVTEIGEMAFMGCSSLISLNLPESITVISGCMFAGCTSLSAINIPESVSKIGDSAFINCSSLTSVKIHGRLRIEERAFDGTPIEINFNSRP